MPVDSLCIFTLADRSLQTISSVSDFSLPSKYAGFVVYTKKWRQYNRTPPKMKKEKEVCDVTAIIIRKLVSGNEDTIRNAKDYVLAEDTPLMAYSQCLGDSLARYSVYSFDLTNDSLQLVLPDMQQITQLSLKKEAIWLFWV